MAPRTDEDVDLLGRDRTIDEVVLERQTYGVGLAESKRVVSACFDLLVAAVLVLGLVTCVSAVVLSCRLLW
jgi:hypothetical protein